MAYFAKRAGDLDMSALPNKNGASGVIQDLLRGDVQVAFLNVASAADMVQAGKLRALAMVNHTRLPDYPDIPTMQELGYPDVGTMAWKACSRRRARRSRFWKRCIHRGASDASPETQEKFKKQNLQHRTEQVARRRADLACRRNEALGNHHQHGEDRRG